MVQHGLDGEADRGAQSGDTGTGLVPGAFWCAGTVRWFVIGHFCPNTIEYNRSRTTTVTMNNHYIPQLLLRQFSVQGKVNVYDLEQSRFLTSKIKHVFSEQNLFEPCANFYNQAYAYKVKKLTREEVCQLNALILNMETRQFVFHDYNKIRESFWHYDHVSRFIQKKRYDFSRLE